MTGVSVAGRRASLIPLALLLCLASLWLGWSAGPWKAGWIQGLEARALDHLMVLRYQLRGPLTLDPRLCLVGIDEASLRSIPKPTLFWHSEYAQVVEALQKSGAAAVGLDLILAPATGQLEAIDALTRTGEDQLAAAFGAGKVVLIYLAPQEGEAEMHSSAILKATAAGLGAANVKRDSDGLVRCLPLYDRAGVCDSFFARVLEVATGQPLRLSDGFLEGPGRLKLESSPGTVSELRINYPGPSGLFPTASFADLLTRVKRGDALSEYAGKIVWIGPSAPTFQDYRSTPFLLTGKQYLGVEIHMAAANTVLTGAGLAPLAPWAWMGAGLLTTLVSLTVAALLSPRLAVPALLGAGCLYLVLALFSLSNGVWIPLVVPLGMGTVALGAGYLERYLTVERDRRQMRGLFGRMVSDEVMRHVLQNPSVQGKVAVRQEVTILFSDINNFTPQCESSTPEQVIQMLNAYFEEMIEIIYRHGGTIKQFVGDEIMVMFGAPEVQPNHPERAVRCALDMLYRLQQLGEADQTGKGFFDVKVGIHTGWVVLGQVGSDRRSEYAAVGDVVNLTARIEATTKKLNTNILVSDVTYAACKEALVGLEWKSFGPQEFKGKTTRVELYTVLDPGREKKKQA